MREHFIEFDQECGGELADVVRHELKFSCSHGDLFFILVKRFVSIYDRVNL